MNIDVELFLETLPIMAKGMIGIFIVTGIIMLSMYLLNKIVPKDVSDNDKKQG